MANIRDIINGAQLPRFVNKPISIVGKVIDVDANGYSFQLESTDNIKILVKANQEINEPLTGCWVEVHGNSTGKGIQATKYIIFNNEKFDSKSYNKLCKYLYSVPNLWEISMDQNWDE